MGGAVLMAFPRRLTWAEAQDFRSRYEAGHITLRGISQEAGWNVRHSWRLVHWKTYKNPTSTPEPEFRFPPVLTRCPEHGVQLEIRFTMLGETIGVCPVCMAS
jgi:hypothetical protein